MYNNIRRLVFGVIFIVFFLSSYSVLKAEPVRLEQAQKITENFLRARSAQKRNETISIEAEAAEGAPTISEIRELRDDDGTVLAYIAELEPFGFIATSANTDFNPIIAYSYKTSFPSDKKSENPLYFLLKEDMKLRIRAITEYDGINTFENNNLWNLYENEDISDSPEEFQQWPRENTTTTGGWIETAWNQRPPYNDFCPIDPVDSNRCYVGCVATAMAQLINYYQQCNIYLSESDSYSTGSGIDIDDDNILYDFPSFEQLNDYLDTLRFKYSDHIELDDTDVAALSFACGIAASMDYSSEGSGASFYDTQQALLDKFVFNSADIIGSLSHEYFLMLQENIINQIPALLAIRPSDGLGGHIIICDGYNTNGEYHLNFGWGLPHPEFITEVWYRLPTELPPFLCIIDEAMLNIQPMSPSIEIDSAPSMFYGAPGQESVPKILSIKNNATQSVLINSISSPDGFIVSGTGDNYSDHIDSFEIQNPGQESSIYVKFSPDEARGYYGTMTIDYADGKRKNVILKGCSFAGGTEIQAGEVSGTWTKAQSPYFVYGDIYVSENDCLLVEPGVKVIFTEPNSLTVGENSRLIAEGTENQMIEFTAWNKDVGWTGLRFIGSGDDDKLSYCSITFSKKYTALSTQMNNGNYSQSNGGAIYCFLSSPAITNCKITNNTGNQGGAIYCYQSYPVISNTVIANNSSLGGGFQCGGIFSDQSSLIEIKNCTIVNNSPGGVFTSSGDGVEMANSIIWGNERYQIQTLDSVPVLFFCDVQGGYPGQGNIDADPNFFAPSFGTGIEHDGLSAIWSLRSFSPCINAGAGINLPPTDLAGNPRIYSEVIDIGAYENQSDLPLITTTAASIDAGFVNLYTDSTVSIVIINTGMINFHIEDLLLDDPNSVFSIMTDVHDYLLKPGDSVQAVIGFTPSEESIYNGTLYIHSTCSNAPQKQISLHGVGVVGTIVPDGAVSGTWSKVESPYSITGDIYIPEGQYLTIEPGVVVKFAGHFGLTVGKNSMLSAIGSKEDGIVFTARNKEQGWFGIRFIGSGDDDILKYCTIEYSKKSFTSAQGYLDLTGGGILCCAEWGDLSDNPFIMPDITISSPTIEHCLITNNHALNGGGIACVEYCEANIIHNKIVDNTADYDGAGIFLWGDSSRISNNIIAHNSGMSSGGIYNEQGGPLIINNTIVHNRPNALYLDTTDVFFTPVVNNIIWENEIYMPDYVWQFEYDIIYNDIQGSWDGLGNIEVDPCFADPENRDYHLKSQIGRWNPNNHTWVEDNVSSLCIDAGEPDSDFLEESLPNGNRINMGAYGGTKQASRSLSADNISN